MSAPLTVKQRAELLLSIAEDVQGGDRLEQMLTEKPNFRAYNGFEPSGRMHIAQALVTAINTNAITDAGGTMVLYIADFFAQLNHKMGGDINKIHEVGLYFIEVFRACGMNLDRVEFVWTSEFIAGRQREYFEFVNDIAAFATVARIKRTVQIMGRQEGDNLSLSQMLYPCMQTTDVFLLDVEICQLGVDQRKVNMLAIEYANATKRRAPIVLSHHMLMGLKGPANKMSKSDPDGAVFIEDSRDDIVRKIGRAHFPPNPAENPLFEYLKFIILRRFPEVTLAGKTYKSAQEIFDNFAEIYEHGDQVKADIAEYVDRLIQPIRDHFQSTPELQALLQRVDSYRVTR
jgi:tyrosyl-tRNA synthetase